MTHRRINTRAVWRSARRGAWAVCALASGCLAEPPASGERACHNATVSPGETIEAVSRWKEAWVVPLARGDRSALTAAANERGDTFVGNSIPWVGVLPVPETSAPRDVLVSALDPEGATRWVVRTNGEAPPVGTLIPTGEGGVVAVFPCVGVVSAAGIECQWRDLLMPLPTAVASFDARGTLRWSRTFEAGAFRGSRGIDRDGVDNLYLLLGETLTSLDRAGNTRWSVPAGVSQANEMLVRPGSVEVAGADPPDPPGPIARKDDRERTIRWSRWRTDGTPVAQGNVPLAGLFGSRDYSPGVVTDLRLGRDGDFYGLLSAHTLGEPGFEFQGVSLFRIERSGRVRWRWGGISISLYALDRCGNPCAFSTPFYRIETVMGRSRCPQPPPTRHLYRLTPDGEENLSLASPVEADRAYQCPTTLAPLAMVAVESRSAADFTQGDRFAVGASWEALVKYAPESAPTCLGRQNRCGGRCVDTATDPAHCGACGNTCRFAGGAGRCVGGRCFGAGCAGTRADCDRDPANGCEVDLATDPAHCGACGRACEGGCRDGRCCVGARCSEALASDGHEGAFAPRSDVTLRAGVHHFTTIDIPAGVTVRTTEGGVLDLRATGDVRLDGVIDLSGGAGGDATQRALNTPAAGGGHTGRPGASEPGQSRAELGGGAGEGTSLVPFEGYREGDTLPPEAGDGDGGGAGGVDHHGTACGRFPPPGDDSLAAREARIARRGWWAPYRGRSLPVVRELCSPGLPVGGVAPEVVYSTEGLPGEDGSIGGAAALDLGVFTTFRPGSGGGGGPNNRVNCTRDFAQGGGGGGGGGALRVTSSTRIVVGSSGRALANGGASGPDAGAGSGGVVYLAAPEVRVAAGAVVQAVGGAPPATISTGLGRIRLSVDPARCALDGAFNPPLADGCNPTPDEGVWGHTFLAPWPR
jgi:hypothetical protein